MFEDDELVSAQWKPRWASVKDVKLLAEKLDESGTSREKYWEPTGGEHEVSFALQLYTEELVVHKTDPAKPLATRREEAEAWKKTFDQKKYLTGTIDFVWWAKNWVDDLKTSHWPPDPATSKQLLSYLLVVWIKAGKPLKWKGQVSITHWEKYPKAKKPRRRGAFFTGLDMMAHLQDLRWAVEHPDEVNVVDDEILEDGSTGELSPCIWCPCRVEIPATAWMQNYRHRQLFACWPGIKSRIKGLND